MTTENATKTSDSSRSIDGLVLCRDCIHWSPGHGKEHLKNHPRNRKPEDGYIEGVCEKLKQELDIEINAGWEGGAVGFVRTDANFGCVFGNSSLNQATQ